MKNNKRFAISAIVVIGSFFATAHDAVAKDRRITSSVCHAHNNAITSVYNGSYLGNLASTTKGIYCPIATDSYLSHGSAALINVHGYEASGKSNTSKACIKYHHNGSTKCGATRYWGAGYTGGINVDASAWQSDGAAFPYLYTSLGGSGKIFGIWYRN